MRKRRNYVGDTKGQLHFAWDGAGEPPSAAVRHPSADPRQAPSPLVQRLPWDFVRTFPQPRQEAIDEGIVDESDLEPQNLASLHENYADQCLAALRALDVVMDARRLGVDPATGNAPRSLAAKERLRKYFQEEPQRLERTFAVLIETYDNAFGEEAADAFSKAIRARHAGIGVAVSEAAVHPAAKEAIPQPKDQPQAGDENTGRQSRTELLPARPIARRVIARLPVPRPLAKSVEAGRFGRDDEGKPIHPGPDEVRAITENHAAKLIALLDVAKHSVPPGREVASADYEAGLKAYAEDFGHDAARELESYVQRQASAGESRRHVAPRWR